VCLYVLLCTSCSKYPNVGVDRPRNCVESRLERRRESREGSSCLGEKETSEMSKADRGDEIQKKGKRGRLGSKRV
jgi:hypothetical protein